MINTTVLCFAVLCSGVPYGSLGDAALELREWILSGSRDQRGQALYAVAQAGPVGVEFLSAVETQLDGDDEYMVAAALDAISSMGPAARTVELHVATLLSRTESNHVRGKACECLGRIGSQHEVTREVLKRMMRGEDGWVRAAAAGALMRISGEDDGPLEDLAVWVDSPDQRSSGPAWAEIASLAPSAPRVVPLLVRGCRSANEWYRKSCVWALCRASVTKEVLLSATTPLLDDPVTSVRAGAILARAKAGGDYAGVAKRLKEEWERCEPPQRLDLETALSLLARESEAAVSVLVNMLADKRRTVRHGAAAGLLLAGHANEEAVEHFVRELGNPDWLGRLIAVNLLSKAPIGVSRKAEVLALVSKDVHPGVRWLCHVLLDHKDD